MSLKRFISSVLMALLVLTTVVAESNLAHAFSSYSDCAKHVQRAVSHQTLAQQVNHVEQAKRPLIGGNQQERSVVQNCCLSCAGMISTPRANTAEMTERSMSFWAPEPKGLFGHDPGSVLRPPIA